MNSIPILTKEELLNIGNTVLKASTSDTIRVQIKHTARSVTRIANNRVYTSDNGDFLQLSVQLAKGGRLPISMTLNQVDDASIRSTVKALDDLARVQTGSPNNNFSVPDEGPQMYIPVSLWHDSTVNAMATAGDATLASLIEPLRMANLRGSGFLGIVASSILVMQKDGLVAFSRETDAECTVSARTPDGKASGWFGQADRDWSKINPDLIATKAIEMANRGLSPSAVEPGRRTAILSPFALAQILRHVSKHFNAYSTNVIKATAFSINDDSNRANRIGLRVFDPRVRITSDPADSAGGFTPFGDMNFDSIALPTKAMSWVKEGVLLDLAYNIYYGLDQGKPFSQNPWGMRFEAKPGTPLQTIEEMIADCDEGIYINRLSDVSQINSVTGMQTGVTRDGCFLVRKGKIDRPITNFRFTDSPFFFLNNIVAIGKAERVAMGYTKPDYSEPEYAYEWPRRPMILPPVMVRDFHFSAISEAV